MKAGGGKRKGGKFERDICKELSLWWSQNGREDIFYRTASSGGRATVRAKQKKKTHGQYGDIQAVDPIGAPLTSLCVIECKDGYASSSMFDLADRLPKHKPEYGKFIEQVITERKEAKTPYWMLIARRKGRRIMIYIPWKMATKLAFSDMTLYESFPWIRIKSHKTYDIFGTEFSNFLHNVEPKDIIRLTKESCNGNP